MDAQAGYAVVWLLAGKPTLTVKIPTTDYAAVDACEQAFMTQCEARGAEACGQHADGFCVRAFAGPTVKDVQQAAPGRH